MEQPAVTTIGVFDGVHRGHQLLLARTARAARATGGRAVAVTFDPHPAFVVRPDAAPLMLTTLDRRERLLRRAGADEVRVVEFTAERAAQSAEDFVSEVLVGELGTTTVVIGAGFRFGHRAAGDVETLRRGGLAVDAVDLLSDGEVLSSSYVRSCVAAGDVSAAARALGRPHLVEGPVVRGEGRGRGLGYPTANVGVAPGIAVPADGVYAGRLVRDGGDGDRLTAAVSVGSNPTFDGTQRTVEAYVLDRDDLNLYDEPVVVEFVERLRPMERFDSVEALVARMADDVEATRAALDVRDG